MRATVVPSLDPGAYPFRHTVRARFAETDAMGVVHHAAYLPWLEEARVAYLRALGRPYADVRAGGTDLAVIEAHVSYLSPARFDEAIEIALGIGAVRGSTFQIAYLLTRGDERIATAVTVHACLDARTGRPQRAPAWLAASATTLP
jgi:acyl-CoA thioester hydrolase